MPGTEESRHLHDAKGPAGTQPSVETRLRSSPTGHGTGHEKSVFKKMHLRGGGVGIKRSGGRTRRKNGSDATRTIKLPLGVEIYAGTNVFANGRARREERT